MLHVDIWYQGENIFCDGGSFSYNTDKQFKNNFSGTIGHNTIMINNDNQMQQVLNFGWSNWTQSKLINFTETSFEGEHYGYQKRDGVVCRRLITLGQHRVTIIDKIYAMTQKIDIKQLWNTNKEVKLLDVYRVQVDSCILESNFPIKLEKTYISDYYNSYVEGTKIVIEVQDDKDIEIKTTLEFFR